MKANDPELQEFLDKYPRVFKELKYLETNKGWNTLLHGVCSILEWHIEQLPEELRDQVFASQIKSKFGILRYYTSHSTPFMDGVIVLAEALSAHICEHCGLPGELRGGGWIRTLCDTCEDEQKAHEEEVAKKYRTSKEDKI